MRDLILLSGGLDSTTALTLTPTARLALAINYGQRHHRELEAAAAVAAHFDLPFQVLDLTHWGTQLASALTSDIPVPTTDYDAPSMAATVVPNRNGTFVMAAAGIAQTLGLNRVVTAVHAGDHHLYPDCRPDFIHLLTAAVEAGTGMAVTVHAPFTHWSKTDIVRAGHDAAAPFHLTWSCYQGGAEHCGVCGTCRERRDAFQQAGVPDPTTYSH